MGIMSRWHSCILSTGCSQRLGGSGFLHLTCVWNPGIDFLISVLIVFPFRNFQNYFFEELQKWRCPDYYENNVHKMQLPFSNKLLGSTLSSEEKQERRQQQLRRLQELNARRREEKLQLDQERLDRLLYVQVRTHPGRGIQPLREAVPERCLSRSSSSTRKCGDSLIPPWGQEGAEGAQCGAPPHRGP